jgi:hypothetical protein
MVIRVYQSQIRADKRPTVSSSPSINTGAAEFYSGLADTISRTGTELGDFFIKKKQNEIELESQINNGQVNEELTELYNSYLDPQGEMYLTPEKWVSGNESFQVKANEIINKKYNSIENKMVADSVRAKFSENFLTLEKELTKKSYERTSNLLESSLSLNIDNTIKEISESNDGFQLAQLTDNLIDTVKKQISAGFYKKGETYDTIIQGHFSTIARNRIISMTDKMNLSQVKNSFKNRDFGDEVTNAFLESFTKEDYENLQITVLDNAKEKFKKIIEFEDQANKFFELKHEDEIAAMIEEQDPIRKRTMKDDLMLYAVGDFALEQIVEEAYKTEGATEDIGDETEMRMSILLGEISYNDLIQNKNKFTKETFNTLQDLWSTNNRPQSGLVKQIRNEIKTLFFFNDDRATKRDDALAKLFDAQLDITLQKFNRLIRDKDTSPQEAYDKIVKESANIINQEVFSLFENDLKKPNSWFSVNQVPVTPETFYEVVEEQRNILPENKKKALNKSVNTIILLYGDFGVIPNGPSK